MALAQSAVWDAVRLSQDSHPTGAHMPSKFVNRVLICIIESPLHPLAGPTLAVIRVVGRRTGRT